ncbi:hypothetical protein [Methylorubrum extorquens]|uniref:hypothetical protein n=1 Tax=Methylorubrum extorquens TaxID=408 RepID=UPI0020A21D94|nr:hypothetical protein [Methylorubrum extorquens]MCP1539975.1 cation transporter-like permease [Methylorubrum extorquens]
MNRLARINLTLSGVAWIVAGLLAALATWLRGDRDANLFEIFLIVTGFAAFVVAIVALCRGLECLELRR